jgi:hypothetical protein
MRPFSASAVLCFVVSVAQAQQPPAAQSERPKDPHADCPMHKAHGNDKSNSAAMNERGAEGMGFSQTATTHQFLLNATGGVIQVEVNDSSDTATRDNIRMHLSHIAKAFSSGDFAIPMFVHDTTPPAAPVMKQLKDKIRYEFEETQEGARVVIATADPDALAAVLQFLKFQIAEHKTGDSKPGMTP